MKKRILNKEQFDEYLKNMKQQSLEKHKTLLYDQEQPTGNKIITTCTSYH